MARSSDINQRIVLTGAEEVRRHLEEIGKAGVRSGNQARAALIAATQGATGFTAGTRAASGSSGQLRFALQNLSFQVNDVATGLASGQDAMRVFAQQGGQIFQVFQQGGGAKAVLGGAATAIRSMITPMTAAAAGAVALAAGLAFVISRAVSMETSTREFDVVLKGLGKTSRATGRELTQSATNLKDVGLSFSEAQKAFKSALQQGVDPRQLEKVVRTGANLNLILGEGSLERFIAAAAKGGEPLREFGERLGIIPKGARDAQKGLDAAAAAAARSTQAISDAIISRGRSIVDEQRQRDLAIADLTRKRGTAQEEIELASSRRIEEINRASNIAINEILAQRSADNAKRLAEFNQQTLEAAQKSADAGQALIDQISGRADGARREALGPLGLAIDDLRISWDALSNTVANSWFIQFLLGQLKEILDVTRLLITELGKIGSGPSLPALLSGGSQGFAAGGLVRGPGTGTSDSVPIMASKGEFVLRAAAVRKLGLDVVSALNMGNLMPRMRMPRGFAAGGLVGAGAGGVTPVHIHLDGRSFPMTGERGVVDALTRAARKSALLSAGRKPSTA